MWAGLMVYIIAASLKRLNCPRSRSAFAIFAPFIMVCKLAMSGARCPSSESNAPHKIRLSIVRLLTTLCNNAYTEIL